MHRWLVITRSIGCYRSLVPKLPKIPILIVAVVTDGCLSNQLVEEGLELADQCGAMFLTTHEWRGEGWGGEGSEVLFHYDL